MKTAFVVVILVAATWVCVMSAFIVISDMHKGRRK